MFHDKLVGFIILLNHLTLFDILKNDDPLLGINLITLNFEHFVVRNHSFLRLFTLFIQNTQIVPNLVKLWT